MQSDVIVSVLFSITCAVRCYCFYLNFIRLQSDVIVAEVVEAVVAVCYSIS